MTLGSLIFAGSIICVAPNEYSISGSDALGLIYTHSDNLRKICGLRRQLSVSLAGLHSTNGPDEARAQPLDDSLPAQQYIRLTQGEGAETVSAFETAAVKQYEPSIDECIDVLHDRLLEYVVCEDAVKVWHTMSSFTWDVFSATTV